MVCPNGDKPPECFSLIRQSGQWNDLSYVMQLHYLRPWSDTTDQAGCFLNYFVPSFACFCLLCAALSISYDFKHGTFFFSWDGHVCEMQSGALPPSRRTCDIWPFYISFLLWLFEVKSHDFSQKDMLWLYWIYLKKIQMITSITCKMLYVPIGFFIHLFVSDGVPYFPCWPWTHCYSRKGPRTSDSPVSIPKC